MTPGPSGSPPVPVIEIGGSHALAAMVDLDHEQLLPQGQRSVPLQPDGSALGLVSAIVSCASALDALPGQSWGIALPGPFDYRNGIALYEGVGKFDALYGVDLKRAFQAALPGPPGEVVFMNDAHAFLWGEWMFGAARGFTRCAAITLGTGIGSAFLAEGSFRDEGPDVPPEGRVDLLEVEGRRLEELVSSRALLREYRQQSGTAVTGVAALADRARSGDHVAKRVLEDGFSRLGEVLSPWLRSFDAHVVVVGGAMTGSWDLIGPPLSRAVAGGAGSPSLVVRLANRGLEAPLLGAAAYAARATDSRRTLAPGQERGPRELT